MARKRTSRATTPEGRDLARAIRQGERAKLSQREIAAVLGINERTVRKIKSGQTPGTLIYKRLTREPKGSGVVGAFSASFTIGYDANGQPIIGSANLIVADVRTKEGGRRAPTALDVFAIPNLGNVIEGERARLASRYAGLVTIATGERLPRLRKIRNMRRPAAAILRTGGA